MGLLLAHLALREAINEAQDLLNEVRGSGLLDENAAQRAIGEPLLAGRAVGSMGLPARGMAHRGIGGGILQDHPAPVLGGAAPLAQAQPMLQQPMVAQRS